MKRYLFKLFSAIAVLALMVSLAPFELAAAASPSVFINEIHYDNTGTDTGEAIEIAGPAGTDLTGWSLILYNGNGGAVYNTTALGGGTIPDLGGGFGVIVMNYPVNGIQNGAPDGIALIDASNAVVQFLSYEGTFTAVGGPADGMISTDIGVSEDGSGAVGNSLQLTGSGATYDDFTWASEQANTFGSFNTGQSFVSSAVAVLVINEIDYDQPGTDTAEFVEIKNVGTASANLSEYTLELVNGNGGGATLYQSYTLPAVTLAAGNYFVVCGDAATVPNCDLDVSPDSNLIQNGAPDAVGLRHNGDLVDAVSYEGNSGTPYTEGSGTGLDDNSSVENGGISRFPDGVDTDQNNIDLSFRCSTPGETNVADSSNCVPPNINLVINEVDYDQPSTDTAEFVEIKNNGDIATDLAGWTLELVNGNGGGAVIYKSIDLSGFTIAAGDYFVVCANAATVANCDLDVSPDTNLIQNGSPDAVALYFNGALIDAVSYEGDTGVPYTEGSGTGLEDSSDGSIGRCPDGSDTNQNNVDFVFDSTSTPGAENSCTPPPPPEMCGDPFTPIYEVQGSGLASILVGTEVATEGIVVGDFQVGGKNGFFIQDATGDGNAVTSDGVFIYAPGGMDVSVGDAVRVRGYVSEYFGLTEISASQIWECGTGSVAPTALSLPVTSLDDYEAYEGMLVTFPQDLVISEYFNFDRYGEIVLTSQRHMTPTAEFEPGSPEVTQAMQDYLLDSITLDDGRTTQNPDPAIHPNGLEFTLDNLFRGGDLVTNVTGVLDYSYNLWRIQPTQGADYTPANPRPAESEDVGGNLKVVSMNTLNFFSTIDQGTSYWICGPDENMECRGADTPEEFTRQRDKLIAAIVAMDADVIGLLEIENNLYDEAVTNLVDGLNDSMGAGTYAAVETGAIGTDAIKVALIYKPASVSLVGDYAILDSSVDPRFVDTKNRPALAQTFMDNTTGGIFTVAVNHLKSKGSDCNDLGDYDLSDGAGNCNLTRKAAAEALVDWLATDPTGSGDADFLIIGDLNSYDKEDPIDAIKAGPDDILGTADDYTDLAYAFLGEYAYSYVFDGQIGYLDYGLASANLVGQVTGVADWHVNADEPDLIDYDMTYKLPAQDALYAPDFYRYSDHDPVIIGLNVCDEIAPVIESIEVTPDILWPANHKYVDVTVTVAVSDNFDPNPTVSLVSVTSDEADEGLGDGDFPNDIVIIDPFHIQLRAERSGVNKTGRTYTLTYIVTDACGNFTTGSVSVYVPFDQKKK